MDTVNKAVNGIFTLLGDGTGVVIMKGIVLLIAAALIWWFAAWIKRKQIEQAREKEAADKVKDQQDNVSDNQKEDDQQKHDSKVVDDFLNKK